MDRLTQRALKTKIVWKYWVIIFSSNFDLKWQWIAVFTENAETGERAVNCAVFVEANVQLKIDMVEPDQPNYRAKGRIGWE